MSNITRKPPVHRIILEQMSQCCRIGKIINRPHHHIGPQQQLPEDHPSYPSKTVYPYIHDGQIYTIKSEKLNFLFSKKYFFRFQIYAIFAAQSPGGFAAFKSGSLPPSIGRASCWERVCTYV